MQLRKECNLYKHISQLIKICSSFRSLHQGAIIILCELSGSFFPSLPPFLPPSLPPSLLPPSPPSFLRFGSSILVDTQTSSLAFDRLLFNPQCFALYETPTIPPTMWTDVSMHDGIHICTCAHTQHMHTHTHTHMRTHMCSHKTHIYNVR